MMFHTSPGFIAFSDSQSGSHATMFGPDGRKLAFRSDASRFDDANRIYVWSFEHGPDLVSGEAFVFATADRECVGVVEGGEIAVSSKAVKVERVADGKPHSVSVS